LILKSAQAGCAACTFDTFCIEIFFFFAVDLNQVGLGSLGHLCSLHLKDPKSIKDLTLTVLSKTFKHDFYSSANTEQADISSSIA
jgi:hypothetical protein